MLDSERVTAPLSLTRTGSGEPLLLLHGLGTSRRDFTAVLPALTDRFDVINVEPHDSELSMCLLINQ